MGAPLEREQGREEDQLRVGEAREQLLNQRGDRHGGDGIPRGGSGEGYSERKDNNEATSALPHGIFHHFHRVSTNC